MNQVESEKKISEETLISFLQKTKNGEYAKVDPNLQKNSRIDYYIYDEGDDYFYSMR